MRYVHLSSSISPLSESTSVQCSNMQQDRLTVKLTKSTLYKVINYNRDSVKKSELQASSFQVETTRILDELNIGVLVEYSNGCR